MEETNIKVDKRFKFEDFTGKMFGDWEVLALSENKTPDNRRKWICKCHCGYCNEVVKEVNERSLKSKSKTKGCGIKSRKQIGTNNRKHNTYELFETYGLGYLNDGKFFIFDIEDYEKISKYYWFWHKGSNENNYYIRAYEKREGDKNKFIFLHNLVMDNLDKEVVIDHINGETNDNRKENLRKCEQSNNMKNLKKFKNNTSGKKGVCPTNNGKWSAYIQCNKENINLGIFENKEDAILVRLKAEEIYFKDFNRENE